MTIVILYLLHRLQLLEEWVIGLVPNAVVHLGQQCTVHVLVFVSDVVPRNLIFHKKNLQTANDMSRKVFNSNICINNTSPADVAPCLGQRAACRGRT